MILGLALLICGFIASFNYLQSKYPVLKDISGIIEKAMDVVAWITVFVGVWKFFGPDYSVKETLPTPFIGDLIPSVLAVCAGLITNNGILNIFNMNEEKRKSFLENLEKFRIPVGFAAMGAGFIHIIAGGSPLI